MPEFPLPSHEGDVAQKLKKVADNFAHPVRAPILQTPAELGLDFEDVTFPSSDGVPIEAWFIPRPGSTTPATTPNRAAQNGGPP